MKIIVLGATGRMGSRIVKEALERGHEVTGVARTLSQESVIENSLLSYHCAHASSPELPELIQGHDVVISTMRFSNVTAEILLNAIKASDVRRLIVVGGSGSLYVAPGVQLVDTPDLPEIYRQEALAGRTFLNDLKEESEVEWTFISPTATLDPGVRTDKYRIGGEQLMLDEKGNSFISMEDFSIALLDEAENNNYIRKRFQVGH